MPQGIAGVVGGRGRRRKGRVQEDWITEGKGERLRGEELAKNRIAREGRKLAGEAVGESVGELAREAAGELAREAVGEAAGESSREAAGESSREATGESSRESCKRELAGESSR